MTGPRIALIHDWLTGMRGGEKCLEVACRRFPDASLHTLLHAKGKASPAIERLSPRTSFLQHIPGIAKHYRHCLPLMPRAVESLHLPPCDLVLSFSHCVAKGAMAPEGVPHVCYCFTPVRYAWQMRDSYLGRMPPLKRKIAQTLLNRLRDWDKRTSDRVTHFIAISYAIRDRIRACYDRDSKVIYPPVDVDYYQSSRVAREDYYLVVSALVPYKRVDLAIAACNQLKRPLVVIGSGPERERLQQMAGPTVQLLGWQPDDVVRDHLQRCRALLFPGEEDFGIVPVEANACGTPVIAYGSGGATETIVPLGGSADPTGVWFDTQSIEVLGEAMTACERRHGEFNPRSCRRQALRFSAQRYESELMGYLGEVLGAGQATVRVAA